MESHNDHKEHIRDDIVSTLSNSGSQPVIFAGSGLSIRYFSAPNWNNLLKMMTENCELIEQEYGFYKQTKSELEIGDFLVEKYAEWAWDKNREHFNGSELLDYNKPQDIFLKSKISDNLDSMTPDSIEEVSEEKLSGELTIEQANEELTLLRDIQPHSIITTNYDRFIENIFNEKENSEVSEEEKYRVIVGEKVVDAQYKTIGEILKVHGSTTDPESLVLTSDDYRKFDQQKQYLSSKMLTYFAEHPVLIVGYGANDPNVKKIFSWVSQLGMNEQKVIDDIYFLQYVEDLSDQDEFPTEKRITLGNGEYLTVKRIIANDFRWVFEAFSEQDGFQVDVRHLRKLLGNMFEVVKNREPRTKVVDYQDIEEISEAPDKLATVLGISSVGDSPGIQFNHKITSGEAAERVGVGNSSSLNNDIIKTILIDKGVNITAFNNRYHVAFFEGYSGEVRRFSEDAIELFQKVANGEDYELDIPDEQIPEDHLENDKGLFNESELDL